MDNHNALRILHPAHGEDKAAGILPQARGAAPPILENLRSGFVSGMRNLDSHSNKTLLEILLNVLRAVLGTA
jgi:hypothetical protein